MIRRIMKTHRRRFLKASIMAGITGMTAIATPVVFAADRPRRSSRSRNPRYGKLDEILRQPVLKREFFSEPVIIESVELLRFGDNFLCRVRSRDGAEGMSVGHSGLKVLHPLFVHHLQPFFIGKDARDLDLLLEKVFI